MQCKTNSYILAITNMGVKGDKMSPSSVIKAEELMEKLASIEGLHSKKMFGGHGLFHEHKMFGLIDSKGIAFLKVEKGTEETYTTEGAHQHSRMPYYSITSDIYANQVRLLSWTEKAIKASKSN